MARSTARMLTVACVLRVDGVCDFNADYVAKLKRGVERNLTVPYRFVCLSNVDVPCERIDLSHDWRGWWAKLELFRPDIEGRILYFDLDTVIVGNLDEMASVEKFTMIRGFMVPTRRGSGVMMLTDRKPVWDAWIEKPDMTLKDGDQEFIGKFCEAVWQDEVPGAVVSYKNDVLPENRFEHRARVIAFHGKPRPHQLPPEHWMRDYWK